MLDKFLEAGQDWGERHPVLIAGIAIATLIAACIVDGMTI